VTDENFEEVRNLYGHVKEQYGRRENEDSATFQQGSKAAVKAISAGAVRKVGTKATKKVEEESNEVEAHPFIASKKQAWICTECGKSRNSSYHKNAEGKLWLPKKA
jgi:transposase-like protein